MRYGLLVFNMIKLSYFHSITFDEIRGFIFTDGTVWEDGQITTNEPPIIYETDVTISVDLDNPDDVDDASLSEVTITLSGIDVNDISGWKVGDNPFEPDSVVVNADGTITVTFPGGIETPADISVTISTSNKGDWSIKGEVSAIVDGDQVGDTAESTVIIDEHGNQTTEDSVSDDVTFSSHDSDDISDLSELLQREGYTLDESGSVTDVTGLLNSLSLAEESSAHNVIAGNKGNFNAGTVLDASKIDQKIVFDDIKFDEIAVHDQEQSEMIRQLIENSKITVDS